MGMLTSVIKIVEYFFRNFDFVLKECHRALKPGCVMRIVMPYATSLGGDYEFHAIRPRYDVYMDYEDKGMRQGSCKFKINRYLRFSWYLWPLNLLNLNRKLIYIYEQTGLRYLLPAMNIELDMEKA